MDRKNNNTGAIVSIAVIASLIIGGLFGWTVGMANSNNQPSQTAQEIIPGIGGGPEDMNQNNQNQVAFSSSTADFRVKMNSLFKEHGVVASEYLATLYDGKDAGALKSKLDNNSNEIASTIGTVYGNEARINFLEMWNGHIEQYENYTRARKENNDGDAEEAKKVLEDQATRMGQLMNGFDKNFSASRITDLVSEHVRLTLDIIDAHADSDLEAKSDNMKLAFDQAGVFADYVGQIIVNSHPDKVK